MTTIKELKKWLDRFPEDAIIKVAMQEYAGTYESYGRVEFETLVLDDGDIGEGWEFIDFTKNKFTTADSPHFGKRYLQLGESQ